MTFIELKVLMLERLGERVVNKAFSYGHVNLETSEWRCQVESKVWNSERTGLVL